MPDGAAGQGGGAGSPAAGAVGLGAPVVHPEVSAALAAGKPVVALESSVFAQGLPVPHNRGAADRMLTAVRGGGAVPAVTAVIAGVPSIGLPAEAMELLLRRDNVDKVSARDLPAAVARGAHGATTVAGSLALARTADLSVFATGGIGGIHREPPFDESGDLLELSRTPMVVVCSGAKAILDLHATFERLESLGVSVITHGTEAVPGFFTERTGITAGTRMDDPADIARVWLAARALGLTGAVLVLNPPPSHAALPAEVVNRAVEEALARARNAGVSGAATTPFLLAAVEEATGGASLRANLALLESNAALAARIACAIAERRGRGM